MILFANKHRLKLEMALAVEVISFNISVLTNMKMIQNLILPGLTILIISGCPCMQGDVGCSSDGKCSCLTSADQCRDDGNCSSYTCKTGK